MAENNTDLVVEWLLGPDAALGMCLPWGLTAKYFHGDDKIGRWLRRRQDLIGRIVQAHANLASDGTTSDAIRCFCAIKSAAESNGVGKAHSLGWSSCVLEA